MNKVWNLVNGTRQRPPRAPALLLLGEASNQPLIDAASKLIEEFTDAATKASFLLADSISDKELQGLAPILDDPVAVWGKLKQKFARRSEMGQEAAFKQFMTFTHDEAETAEDTISRFEEIVAKCVNQEVEFKEGQVERQLLNKVNKRYNHLKKNYR